MTYLEAIQQTKEEVSQEPVDLSRMFRKQDYAPYGLPFHTFLIAPKDPKRMQQFLDLYRIYNSDWFRAAAHFQFEEFENAAVFKDTVGNLKGISAKRFFAHMHITIGTED